MIKKVGKSESATFLGQKNSKNKYDKSQITQFDFVFDDMLKTELEKLEKEDEDAEK